MSDDAAELTIDELAERSGVPARTIRYYISQGLLPGAGSRGRGAAYSGDHLARLRLIRLLAARRVPLAAIGAQLAGLSDDEVRALLAREEQQAAATEAAETPKEYVARLLERAAPPAAPTAAPAPVAQADEVDPSYAARPPQPQATESWRRIELAPGVELHVRADAERRQHGLIQRLLNSVARRSHRD
ncbi:MAG TPA: MerR family transcriptional regulator [Thermomicrobiaceae bacterium]|nr:MerR family transcriptional regulator [Thermomicrobiaceae bacterium]